MKKLIITLCMFLPFSAFSQKVALTVQTGHSATINEICFSHDMRFIASAGDDNKIVIWDYHTGKQFNVLQGHEGAVTGIAFHPKENILISSSLDGTIRSWDIYNAKFIQGIETGGPVSDIVFSPDGSRMAVAGNSFGLYGFPGFVKEGHSLPAKFSWTTVKWSPDGRKVAVGGSEEPYGFLLDIKDTEPLAKLYGSILCFEFDSSSTTIMYGTINGRAFEYNLETNKRKGTTTDWMLNSVNAVAANDKYFFTANDNGEIRAFEREKWRQKAIYKDEKGKIKSLCLSGDGKYIAAAGEHRRILVWDTENGQVVKMMRGLVSRINDVAFSGNGKELLIGYADGIVRKVDLVTNQSVVNTIVPESGFLRNRGSWPVLKINAFEGDTAQLSMLYQQHSLEYDGVFDKLEELSVTWDLDENTLHVDKNRKLSEPNKNYIRDLKKGKFHPVTYFLDTTLTTAESRERNLRLKIEGNTLVAADLAGKELFRAETKHSDLITSVAINPVYDYVVTASWDGMIRFYDIHNGELLSVFGAFGDGQFVYLHPEGYYFSSKNALDYIGFKIDNKVYSFEQFDLKYNRPDLVARSLPYFSEEFISAYFKAYQKRLKKLGMSESDVEISTEIPELKVTHNWGETKETKIQVSVSCVDAMHDLDRLHIKVNGVPHYGRFGKKINGKTYSEQVELELNPGPNLIQIYVTNVKGVSSLKESFPIESIHHESTVGDLYLVGIGVSEYQQGQYNLNYAGKDAKDIDNFFKGHHRHFKSYHSKILLNEEVTRENVAGVEEFLQSAGVNDVVILFAAGHGVLDNELDYYFASNDMDFADPGKRGIPYDMFDDLMDRTKSRKKVMFIDACHSGEIDKDEVVANFKAEEVETGEITFRGTSTTISNKEEVNTFDLSKSLFADMRLNNGSTVVSSAGGAQFAIEGKAWNNGVFTFSMLNALDNAAADKNKDKQVSLSELQNYIQFEVTKLTNGLQTPTSRVENLNNDFIIHSK